MPEATRSRAEHSEEECDLTRTMLGLIGEKWPLAVLDCLSDGTLRFNELRRILAPITQRMLSQSLRALEQDGLIVRTVYPTVPPKVEYALTDAGRSFNGVVGVIAAWADANLDGVAEARAAYAAKFV